MSYFGNIKRGISSTAKGLSLTLKHLFNARISKSVMTIHDENFFQVPNGVVTLQYPHQTIAVPDHGRYQLDCEIDDCIVCDKCAKVCPVDCIDIEAIKSPELIRITSDGSPVRLHAAKFDIDMAKCCFCGLCTTVCPTECLTMNSEYDYSTIDITNLNFAFSNLTEEAAQEKRDYYDQFVAEKEALKQEALLNKKVESEAPKARPVFMPSNRPKSVGDTDAKPAFVPQKPKTDDAAKPAFKPSQKPGGFSPTQKPKTESTSKPAFVPQQKPKTDDASKPAFKPSQKTASFKPTQKPITDGAPKPAFRPTIKPKVEAELKPDTESSVKPKAFTPTQKPKTEEGAKPAFKPTIKPKAFTPTQKPKTEGVEPDLTVEKKPAFKPTLKPKNEKSKPVFKPTLKPKK
ncbi:NADH-quinone oxidoreductase subunit I [Spirosomataceae bacterium TFI 002]|nr:NADH-quinone oxidoreductase subunit I [Spirosomataceae bacterium TFI 002]